MYKNILVPIAFDENSDARIGMATSAARKLADDGARITFLHVLEQVPGYVASYLPADYTAQARKAIEDEISDIAAAVPGGVGQVISGHSGRTILDWAGDNSVDLIVIASHRPGMQDYLLGSTAAQVVRHAQCSVHVLR
ncbi:universal stress protein [Mameliella sediminis]|uniref:universal stress protein n=1 Tax=Mameliella sediminis TaxID=2836866 RepID=UPI001C48A8A4|nr:universal stress protein [Mameliella sediminis]MBV7394812.1 universal stress protein [Mameliella sediminis]